MIEGLSDWTKNIGFSIIIVSILEMILPNNKTKKYIKIVMGTYIIFCMISPFIQNKINFDDINLEKQIETSTTEVNQESMDRRIEQLYIEELEKDISKKVQEKGYVVKECKVNATIAQNVEDTKINKISLKVEQGEATENQKEEIEDTLVSEIQKIKEVNTTISKENTKEDKKKTKLNETQKTELKKFLKEEYEVNEKCLEIN